MDVDADSMLGAQLSAALGPLRDAGLLDAGQVSRVVEHATGFPLAPLHKIFFEFELAEGGLEFAGYGHGFRPRALTELLAEGSSFAASELGERVLATLATDPFDPSGQRSRRSQDGEVEWFEYDVDGATIADQPGLFFALPAGLRRLHDLAQVRELIDELGSRVPSLRDPGGAGDLGSFAGFLLALGEREFAADNSLRTYRIGLSENRAPGWLRLVVGGLRTESLDELAERAFAQPYLEAVPRRSAAIFSGDERSKLSASIDVVHGRLGAIDLEGPYLFQIPDPGRRVELGRRFCAQLCDDEVIGPGLADTIGSLIIGEVPLVGPGGSPASHRALLLLNHFKFGVAGRHRGRVKLYFEVLMWDRERPGPRFWS